MRTIKLALMLVWNCPGCGRQLVHPGRPVRDPEILADIEDLGEFEAGELMELPQQVACQQCDEVFEVEPDE